jgi:hypothetical protein
MGAPAAVERAFYFCQLLPRVTLLVFLLVSAAIDEFKIKWLWH